MTWDDPISNIVIICPRFIVVGSERILTCTGIMITAKYTHHNTDEMILLLTFKNNDITKGGSLCIHIICLKE